MVVELRVNNCRDIFYKSFETCHNLSWRERKEDFKDLSSTTVSSQTLPLIKMDEGECVQGSGSGSGVANVLTALTHTWHIISVVTQG